MRNVAAAIALFAVAATGPVAGCSKPGPSEDAGLEAAVSPGPIPDATTAPTADAVPPPASGADIHGFLLFGDGARCLGTDNAEMFMRTEESALVVCRSEINRLYYRGYRISDGATIDLYDVTRRSCVQGRGVRAGRSGGRVVAR